jgi:hypothetical protein
MGGSSTQVFYFGVTRVDVKRNEVCGGAIFRNKDWIAEDVALEEERRLAEESASDIPVE